MNEGPQGETYLDVVWKQFRKNRIALAMVWVVLGFFGLAIFAPLIASNEPFWFRDPDGLRFPWLVSLLNPPTAIDFIFNVALVIFPVWLGLAVLLYRLQGAGGVPARTRVLRVTGLFFILLAAAVPFFLVVRPSDRYFARDFKRDQVQGRGDGVYTLVPYGPMEQDIDIIFQPPMFRKTGEIQRYRDGQAHVLGTDDSGRDVFTRILYGTRISMTIGVVAVSIYVTIGIILGSAAGYFGGMVDILISRLIEIVLLFPSLFLILTIVALIGPSIYVIMVVIGFTGWPTIARLTRGEFLRQRSIDYVAAARSLGAGDSRVMFRHILPNALSPAFVAIPFGIVGAIITEATLSVLGFGVRPPAPSWGSILLIATSNYEKWWLTVFAGLSIFVTVTVFNVVGNGLRDAMDPRLKGTR
jgi:ABC-type dipeptide/oligopeptide/nickel transport system permease subunit